RRSRPAPTPSCAPRSSTTAASACVRPRTRSPRAAWPCAATELLAGCGGGRGGPRLPAGERGDAGRAERVEIAVAVEVEARAGGDDGVELPVEEAVDALAGPDVQARRGGVLQGGEVDDVAD